MQISFHFIIFLFSRTTIAAEEPLLGHKLMAAASCGLVMGASWSGLIAAAASWGCCKPFWSPCDSLADYTLELPFARESSCGSACSDGTGCPGTHSALMYSSS